MLLGLRGHQGPLVILLVVLVATEGTFYKVGHNR